MDIRLKGKMDGITAAEEIRRRFHLPVIFMTAYSEEATLERAKLAEPYGYIIKPFDDRPEWQGNPGKAIREGKPFVCNGCKVENCLYPFGYAPDQFGFKAPPGGGTAPRGNQNLHCGHPPTGREMARRNQ
jgi:hypothetical protein